MIFTNENGALVAKRQGETLRIEGWGKDSLRVRSTMYPEFTGNNWALEEKESKTEIDIQSRKDGPFAVITNGRIKATVNFAGVISFYRDEELFLREYFRCYGGTLSRESRCLKYVNREYKPLVGGDYHLTVKFESNDGEKIYL